MTGKGGYELFIDRVDSVPLAAENPLAAWGRKATSKPHQWQISAQSAAAPDSIEFKIPIRCLDDIITARISGRRFARQFGCSDSRVALVLTAISELGRNIISYAGSGEITLMASNKGARDAIVVIADDQGPGIADLSIVTDQRMVEEGAGSCRAGLGLSGLRLCMDHFSIESRPGAGTRVTCEVHSS